MDGITTMPDPAVARVDEQEVDSLHPRVPKPVPEPQEIPIKMLRTDGGTLHRERLNEGALKNFVWAINHSQELPPIEVIWDGQFYWVVDGHHRIEAQRRAWSDKANVMCIVKKGTQEKAQWLSLGTNKTHGVHRTQADKKKATIFALKTFPNKSDRAIGDHVGVDHKTVGKWRKELAKVPGEIPKTVRDPIQLLAQGKKLLREKTGWRWRSEIVERNGIPELTMTFGVGADQKPEDTANVIAQFLSGLEHRAAQAA
jgi:uncharacterized ParB-like nuclease family protein